MEYDLFILTMTYTQSKDPELLQELVQFHRKHRDEIDYQMYHGPHTLLTYCAQQQCLEMVRVLIQEGYSNTEERQLNSFGDTAMLWAAYNDDLEMIDFLVSQGANVNVKDLNGGRTPCAWALSRNHRSVVEWFFLDPRFDPTCTTIDEVGYLSQLRTYHMFGNGYLASLLIARGAHDHDLMISARTSHVANEMWKATEVYVDTKFTQMLNTLDPSIRPYITFLTYYR